MCNYLFLSPSGLLEKRKKKKKAMDIKWKE
jgi:hypothetical protein